MFFSREKENFEGMTKKQLKERLQVLDYEVATIRNKKELKKFYKEIELINKQLRKLKEEEKTPITGRRFK